jgi:hypothetical protein
MESHYSTFDRELLDAHEQSGIFIIFVKVARISIVDRLQTALSRVSAPISPRQQRHLAFISETKKHKKHKKSISN